MVGTYQEGTSVDFNDNVQLDSSQVINAGGSGGGRGGGLAIGGGMGLLIMILGLVFGFDPSALLNGVSADTGQQTSAGTAENLCKNTSDIAKDRDCRWTAYVTSIQNYWGTQFEQGAYTKSPTITFSGQIQTGCGAASSQVGPFYCPADKKVYVDTQFADQLLQQLGAQGGDAAEAYILAHEYGHHISDLTGQLGKAQQDRSTGPDSAQVRLELQADCYAGVWFKNAQSGQGAVVKNITEDDLRRVVDAAAAVGDDRIQESSAGRVNPESWTHGSAQMRQYWVAKGFQTGDPQVCSQTFTTNDLEGTGR